MRRENKLPLEQYAAKTYVLTEYELDRCIAFSKASAPTQQAKEFGQNETKPRSKTEVARDNLIGKMAEMAFSRMLREDFGVHLPINFDIYPRGECDDQDFQINGWKIDVKSTTKGHWMLFEADKLRMRSEQSLNNLPDVILMCQTPWHEDTDEPEGSVAIIGTISLTRLLSVDPKVLRLGKNEYIPGTRTRLLAENYGVHFRDLCRDFSTTIPYLLHNHPPDPSSYRIK